ncbi:hypothetical protein [Brevibacillus sp. NRS-1366]|uniref:hypothetical protein n=1 Tax=Brevibacillus sp. NRS-1366 TaxID=3233899 RepID=UPI003D1DD448
MVPGMILRNITNGVTGTYLRTSEKPNYYGQYVVFVLTSTGVYYAPKNEWAAM